MSIRIDKYLADSGFGTRSETRSLLKSGSVSVNGNLIKDAGYKVDPDKDMVSVRGENISYNEYEYYMLNKPAGVITASSDKREKTVVDLIESKKRRDLFPVGRLDRDTEGLLLITNDGTLAHKLLSPGKHVEKMYRAIVSGVLPDDAVERFAEGIDIGDDKPTKPAKLVVSQSENGRYSVEITITEGRYHEIKRMFEACGCMVEYLKRYSMGNMQLDESLKPGEYKSISEEEIKDIFS